MSDGPIAHWWKSHTPPRVSTPDNKRVCASSATPGIGYCGRSKAPIVQVPKEAARVTCSDCLAAARADAAVEAMSRLCPGSVDNASDLVARTSQSKRPAMNSRLCEKGLVDWEI